MKTKLLPITAFLLLNATVFAEWKPGQKPNGASSQIKGPLETPAETAVSPTSPSLEGSSSGQAIGGEKTSEVHQAEWLKAKPAQEDTANKTAFIFQRLPYLGKITGIDYKDDKKTKIKGFKVNVVNVLKDGNPSFINRDLYLPYVVVIKKHLVTDPLIRNSGGTELEHLDINLDQLIEFEKIAKAGLKTKPWGYMYVIAHRPIVSKVSPRAAHP